MFQTPGTKAGRKRRAGYPVSNNQIIYNASGELNGANLTFSNGALTGNGYGLTILANNGISSNSSGVFANLTATPALQFSSGGLQVFAGNGAVINSSGVCANLSATPALQFSSGGLQVFAGNGAVINSSGVCANIGAGLIFSSGATVINAAPSFTVNTSGLFINSTGTINCGSIFTSGNIVVSGTLITVNTTEVQVDNNFIEVAANQAGSTTSSDLVDAGFVVPIGNTTVSTQYWAGIARMHSAANANNPIFWAFSANAIPTATIQGTTNTAYMKSYLIPYDIGGLFVVNSTAISISGNSTILCSLAANSLTLTTPLPVSNIASGTDGMVIQTATGTTTAFYGMLDGGTF